MAKISRPNKCVVCRRVIPDGHACSIRVIKRRGANGTGWRVARLELTHCGCVGKKKKKPLTKRKH